MLNFLRKNENKNLIVQVCGLEHLNNIQDFQSTAYEPLSSDRKQNVYFCSTDYRSKLFNKGGEAIRLFDSSKNQIAAQAMLTPCANIFEFIDTVGAAANMIEIQNFPGTFAAISNFLINPDAILKRGLAKLVIETCASNQLNLDFTGFICVSTNRAVLKEAMSAGCKIFGITKDKRLEMPTYLLGMSRLHASCGTTVEIDFKDEIVLANYFDMGYAVTAIDWIGKIMKLQMQAVEYATSEQTA